MRVSTRKHVKRPSTNRSGRTSARLCRWGETNTSASLASGPRSAHDAEAAREAAASAEAHGKAEEAKASGDRARRAEVSAACLAPRRKRKPLKYGWWRRGDGGWEVILIGSPDCFGYVLRYWNEKYKCPAWCWILNMPRAGSEVARGWASDPSKAKRQVEQAIQEFWR